MERFEALKERFGGARFTAAEEKLRMMRLIKDEHERKILREAAAFADLAVETGIREIKEGKTELEIVAAIEFAMKEKGISEMSFATTVLSGAKAASRTASPALTRSKKGILSYLTLALCIKATVPILQGRSHSGA